jgi:hypothetical protein
MPLARHRRRCPPRQLQQRQQRQSIAGRGAEIQCKSSGRQLAVGLQLEERMRFFYQKSGNSRKFEYSNRIDQKIDRCSQQNHDVLIPISKEANEKIKVHSHDDHSKAV